MTKAEERAALMARVLELADGTRTKREIAEQVGVSEGTLQVVLAAIQLIGKSPRLTMGPFNPKAISGESDLQTVLSRRDEVFDGTRSHREIADYLGVKIGTVQIAAAILHMAGFEAKVNTSNRKRSLAASCLLEGGTVDDACNVSGLAKQTVWTVRAKLRREGKLKVVTGTMVIDEMYRAGASHKAMAEATGLAMSSVASIISRRIKRGLLEMRPQGGYAKRNKTGGNGRERNSELIQDQVNEVVRYVYLGLTNYEIAKKMGLTMVQVRCRLAKARQMGLIDGRRRNVCSSCHRTGHNSATCSNVAV